MESGNGDGKPTHKEMESSSIGLFNFKPKKRKKKVVYYKI
jgi:hypothetical protein